MPTAVLARGQDLREICPAPQDKGKPAFGETPPDTSLQTIPGSRGAGEATGDHALELAWLQRLFQWLSGKEGYLKGLHLSSQSRQRE